MGGFAIRWSCSKGLDQDTMEMVLLLSITKPVLAPDVA